MTFFLTPNFSWVSWDRAHSPEPFQRFNRRALKLLKRVKVWAAPFEHLTEVRC